MKPDTIYIYTDASFSKSHKTAFIGYAIMEGNQARAAASMSDKYLKIHQINENNNIRSEIRAAIEALKQCPIGNKVLLYCDCQTISLLPSRREKLERTNFISQSKNQVLANADLYQEFYVLYDKIRPEIRWIKGHSPGKDHGHIEKNFSYLDKAVRKSLRNYISERLNK